MAEESNYKIFVVEDSMDHQIQIRKALSHYDLRIEPNMKEAMNRINSEDFDLYILDIMLPDGDGYQICHWLQNNEKTKDRPIIFLSSKSEVGDRVHGLRLGAEDYICKPFAPEELLARVEVKLRKKKQPDTELDLGYLKFDFIGQKIFLRENGEEKQLDLTPREFKILSLMGRHLNSSLERQIILEEVWGKDVHVSDRSIDTHVAAIRKKLGSHSHQLKSVHGKGYMLLSDSDSQSQSA